MKHEEEAEIEEICIIDCNVAITLNYARISREVKASAAVEEARALVTADGLRNSRFAGRTRAEANDAESASDKKSRMCI